MPRYSNGEYHLPMRRERDSCVHCLWDPKNIAIRTRISSNFTSFASHSILGKSGEEKAPWLPYRSGSVMQGGLGSLRRDDRVAEPLAEPIRTNKEGVVFTTIPRIPHRRSNGHSTTPSSNSKRPIPSPYYRKGKCWKDIYTTESL